jgi:hypothetical protein
MITRRRMLAASGGLAAIAAAKAAAAETPIQAVPATPRSGTMEIKRSGSQPSGKGPAEYFTGTVRIDPLFVVGLAPVRLRRVRISRRTDGIAMDRNRNAGGRENLPPPEGPQAASNI